MQKFEGIDSRTIKCACNNKECITGISFDTGHLRFHFATVVKTKNGAIIDQEEKSMLIDAKTTKKLIKALKFHLNH